MSALVPGENRPVPGLKLAQEARERLLTRVSALVLGEVRLVPGLKLAQGTRERLRARMNLLVHSEMRLLRSSILAQEAREWLRARVNPLVLGEIRLALCQITAKAAGVLLSGTGGRHRRLGRVVNSISFIIAASVSAPTFASIAYAVCVLLRQVLLDLLRRPRAFGHLSS